jgi:hypothetical protein
LALEEQEQVEVVRTSVTLGRLRSLAEGGFGDLVKAVVDVEQGVMAIGGGMHADEEAVLIDLGSRQGGSMINLRPAQGNRTRSVDATGIRDRIIQTVGRLVPGG